jgi:hypothetical protein
MKSRALFALRRMLVFFCISPPLALGLLSASQAAVSLLK